MWVCGKHYRVGALTSVFACMNVNDNATSLAVALNIGHSQSHNLSPKAAKLRDLESHSNSDATTMPDEQVEAMMTEWRKQYAAGTLPQWKISEN